MAQRWVFAAGSVRYIFVSHLLEHLFFPRDVKPFLAELRRALAPGGVVRIVVPDIEQSIEAYVNDDRSFFGNRREAWPWWPENPTRLEDFLAYAGANAPTYTPEDLKIISSPIDYVGLNVYMPNYYVTAVDGKHGARYSCEEKATDRVVATGIFRR